VKTTIFTNHEKIDLKNSLGYARLASSITGNKVSIVDNYILRDECKPGSLALHP
jgi:hypothetical protein